VSIILLTEKQLQKIIIEYLRYHPKVAWIERINVGAHVIDEKNSRRFVRYSFKGCSDILGQMKNGKFLAVEVKSARGRLTEYQSEFINKVNKSGGLALVVRSLDDVQDALNNN